ncbi:MAG: hypothetical protein SFV20_10215 [Sphingopyxis sp.]|nr:hypothetical protein [Sphingopyxis sp.]
MLYRPSEHCRRDVMIHSAKASPAAHSGDLPPTHTYGSSRFSKMASDNALYFR